MESFERFKTYRHEHMTDVDMYVNAIENETDEAFHLQVVYVFRHNPELTTQLDYVVIQKKDLNKWAELASPIIG